MEASSIAMLNQRIEQEPYGLEEFGNINFMHLGTRASEAMRDRVPILPLSALRYVKLFGNPNFVFDPVDLEAANLLEVYYSPFTDLKDYKVSFRPQDQHALGFQCRCCPHFTRATITAFNCSFGSYNAHTF